MGSYYERAGNNAEERRQSEPQSVKQQCGCETLQEGKYMVFIDGGRGRRGAKKNIGSKRDEVTGVREEDYVARSFIIGRSTRNHIFMR